ncbi:endonuclease MutS2 [Acholeplasma hippikon]|uniref:Endonuclease MutS2 n=1 Tax=Acholeplasma hippikon TaxID=264636 RepID=A0A449BJD5_9MOLU|nr:endonuclease MutS2 [Acholeplasma hippikon]VEU82503.1 MutS2 protein [Acholeplasma hippikon]
MGFSTKILELNYILEIIANYTHAKNSRERILALVPSDNYDNIKHDLSFSNEILSLLTKYGRMPFVDDFDHLETINMLGSRLQLNIDEFIQIKRYVLMEKSFENYRIQFDNSDLMTYQYLVKLPHHKEVLNEINQIISENNEIFDHASPTLNDIRKSLRTKTKILEKLLSEVLSKYASYLNESLIVMRAGRYAIPVKESYKHKVKGVIHDVSASKQTVYIEPDDIRQVTQDIEYLTQLETNEINKILTQLTKSIKPFKDSLAVQMESFIDLDIYHAKSLYAKEIDAILPEINEEGLIDILKARHPLLNKEIVVPIDVKINPEQPVLMITGPNTGGKTVALKTVGLLTLMLQSGILVPVNYGSKMSLFKYVFADIGDEQSIQQSLSTFSSHLTKIKKMLDEVYGSSLILLDEIGSGTDPIEGVSLAIAIIEKLRKDKAVRMMVTTHYSELKLYAYEHDDILTASVAFDQETLKPLYKLQLGVSGSSHAISIAERLGLQKDVIKHARELLGGRQTNLAKSLEKLSIEQNEIMNLKDEVQLKNETLEKEIKLYREKLEALELKKEEAIEKVKQKEEKKYQKLKSELMDLIDELSKKESLSKPEAAKVKGKINQKHEVKEEVVDENINVDDTVYIKSYNQQGVVTKIKGDKYFVSLGQFDLSFEKADLRKVEIKKETKVKKTPLIRKSEEKIQKNASFELDLRGVRYEEVKELMDKAIDDALLLNMPYIRVIHGFGTGAIRKAVHDYIKKSPYIKSHRYGQEGEGLNGVTVITL